MGLAAFVLGLPVAPALAAHCPGIREVSVTSILKAADLGQKLGARVMVVHNGGYAPPGRPGTPDAA